jgi:phosphoribosylcarboxyaminoimidazole (NCAIR) mutase
LKTSDGLFLCEQASLTVAIVVGSKSAYEVTKKSAALLEEFMVPHSDVGGLDSLLATVQMPAGIPVGTTAIGKAGAKNAALQAVSVLALSDTRLRDNLKTCRLTKQAEVEAADTEIRELSRV